MVEIMKKAKQTPGVATYNIDKYDEKYVKPPRQGSSDKAEKYTYVDSIMFEGKKKPGLYDPIKLVSSIYFLNFFRTLFFEKQFNAKSGKNRIKRKK